MLDVRKAIDISRIYLIDLLQLTSKEIRLEEVELSDDEKYWLITLSFVREIDRSDRIYKIFKINSDTGNIESLKIRHL